MYIRKISVKGTGYESSGSISFAGSEDFGLYLTGYEEIDGVKGSFGMIGARSDDPKTHNFNHSSDFNVDESVLKNEAMMYTYYAYEYLNQDEF